MTLPEAVSAARHADPRPFIANKHSKTVLSIVGIHLYYTDESGVKGMFIPDACDLWGDTEWELRNTLS